MSGYQSMLLLNSLHLRVWGAILEVSSSLNTCRTESVPRESGMKPDSELHLDTRADNILLPHNASSLGKESASVEKRTPNVG